MENYSVLGCGRWGSFIAWYLNRIGKNVVLWGRPGSQHLLELQNFHKNKYLSLDKKVELTNDINFALDFSEYIIISIHGQELNNFVKSLPKDKIKNKKFILCMKGLDYETNQTLTTIMSDYVPKENLAIWIGPGQPQDLVLGKPNCMLIDSFDNKLSDLLIKDLSSDLIFITQGNDVLGNEYAAAYKNIIGIAGGILDGLNLKSLKGPLMVYGTKEISELIKTMGGKAESAYGLGCLGDYEASMFSEYSNSRKLGESLVTKQNFNIHAPGYFTAKSIKYYQEKFGLDLPICNAVYNIIYNEADCRNEVNKLLKSGIK